jgi:hypothetical protein
MFDLQIEIGQFGYWIIDGFGEEVAGPFTARADAERKLDELARAHADNYEPPDPPGWEGGFADNH